MFTSILSCRNLQRVAAVPLSSIQRVMLYQDTLTNIMNRPVGVVLWGIYLLTTGLTCVLVAGANENGEFQGTQRTVSPKNCEVWGPGLRSNFFLPVRYFYIQAIDETGEKFNASVGEKAFTINLRLENGERVRCMTQLLDRHDGTYIVRYRPFVTIYDLEIDVMYQGQHVGKSPYKVAGPIYHETCDCPQPDLDQWFKDLECPASYHQIQKDLSIFKDIDSEKVTEEAVRRFNRKGAHSLGHYKVIDNKLYRQTHGQHVGFKMFADAILLSIMRKVRLPDMEFMMNFGDWPLEKKKLKDHPIPIFSWCGSEDSHDIVLPTYDITEATLEMMSRVSLDIFSVQSNTGPKWDEKANLSFWRGRDSCKERLNLVQMARKHPDLINASLTNMFFFPKDEEKFGKLVKHVSFFEFFKYKYQLNIDGTVAAYRFPYLLGGDALVMKQDSHYYEHFYNNLEPNVHYIPIRRDLKDLLDKIAWAKEHDEEAREIARNGQEYVKHQLNPADIFCYHVRVFTEYAKLLKNKPKMDDGFEEVEPKPSHLGHNSKCECQPYTSVHDEL